MGKVILLAILAALAGCTTDHSSAVTPDPKKTWCDLNQPRRPTTAEIAAMDRTSLDALNAFNMRQEQWCGRMP